MATTLYLKSSLAQISRGTNTNDQRGSAKDWRAYALSTAVGTGAGSSATASSAAGPVAGIEFIATGTVLAEWISEPLGAAVTISGTVSYRFCGSESNTMANGSASFRVDRLDSTGAIASTVATASHGTELTATSAQAAGPFAHSFTATPTSTAFSKGDRIRIVAFVDDNATTTNMASGYTFTLNFDGAAASTADTYVQFTENLTWGSSAGAEKKLVASDKAAVDNFGVSVACSSDGSVLVVGANGSDPGGTSDAGAVYVYWGTNYGTETKLVASDKAANDQFGYSVACSSDGSKIVVGARDADPSSQANAGAVYVYSGSNWGTETKLVASDKAAGDRFGASVACSSDGSVVIVGASDASPGGTSVAGAAYVYSGSGYATEKKLVASDKSTSASFGTSVSCSGDGSLVAVGSPYNSTDGVNLLGAAYLYSGAGYVTETKLTASDKANGDAFGQAVACSSNGSVVVVGAYLANPGGTSDAGAAYVYSGSSFGTETKLVASDKAASAQFGEFVAISGDGSFVAIAAPRATVGGSATAGAIYAYGGPGYAAETKLTASDKAAGDQLGKSVACSAFGAVVSGAPFSDPGGTSNAGAVYSFLPSPYFLTATASDIADQSTDEKKIWTAR